MKPIHQAWCCQIEITNHCDRSCLYCSRYNRHLREDQRYHMDIGYLEMALNSLENWPNKIGIIGGEPILHPQFEECCKLIQTKFPKEKMGLWTSGGEKWEGYRDIVADTFGFVAYNEHNNFQKENCRHQPLTLAISDLVMDVDLMMRLIDDCWVQRTWCPTINPNGAYFCEVAGALDYILDGISGFNLQKNWWAKNVEDFKDQIVLNCFFCGMALPYERELLKNKKEKFSPRMVKIFREHKLANMGDDKIEVVKEVLSEDDINRLAKTWYPGNYRGDTQDDINSIEGKGSTIFGN